MLARFLSRHLFSKNILQYHNLTQSFGPKCTNGTSRHIYGSTQCRSQYLNTNLLYRSNKLMDQRLTLQSCGRHLSMKKNLVKDSTAPTSKVKSHMDKIKALWKKYGVVSIGTYLATYIVVLSSFYVGIEYGLFKKTKPISENVKTEEDEDFDLIETTNKFVEYAQKLGIADMLEVEKVNSRTGSFLLAWVATKFTEPLRLAFTLAVTPRIARYLGKVPK